MKAFEDILKFLEITFIVISAIVLGVTIYQYYYGAEENTYPQLNQNNYTGDIRDYHVRETLFYHSPNSIANIFQQGDYVWVVEKTEDIKHPTTNIKKLDLNGSEIWEKTVDGIYKRGVFGNGKIIVALEGSKKSKNQLPIIELNASDGRIIQQVNLAYSTEKLDIIIPRPLPNGNFAIGTSSDQSKEISVDIYDKNWSQIDHIPLEFSEFITLESIDFHENGYLFLNLQVRDSAYYPMVVSLSQSESGKYAKRWAKAFSNAHITTKILAASGMNGFWLVGDSNGTSQVFYCSGEGENCHSTSISIPNEWTQPYAAKIQQVWELGLVLMEEKYSPSIHKKEEYQTIIRWVDVTKKVKPYIFGKKILPGFKIPKNSPLAPISIMEHRTILVGLTNHASEDPDYLGNIYKISFMGN